MKIVIVGAGKVGSYLTSQLSLEKHDILVIDKDKDIINKLLEKNDVMAIVGDGTDTEILREADAGSSDLFIALTMSDDVNLLSSAIARSLGADNIIIRLRDPKYLNNHQLVKDITNANLVINPEYLAAKEIQRSIKYSHARNVETFLEDRAMMIEVVVGESSPLIGSSLRDNYGYLKEFGVLIGVVNNHGTVVIPKGNFRIEAGHKIYVFGTKDRVDSFYKAEIPENIRIQDVLIIGASATAYQLTALLLERKFNVTIIEIDKQKALDIQDTFPAAVVINADGSDPDILDEVRIDSFDSVIALTGIDEENILIALMAERYGIRKNIAKVNRTNLLKITGILDIDATFTPKSAASHYIYRLIRSKDAARDVSLLNNLYRIEDDQVEILEFEVSENSKIFDTELKDLKIKEDTLVAAIDHRGFDNELEIANGNSVIKMGDRVLVITKSKNFKEIDDILE